MKHKMAWFLGGAAILAVAGFAAGTNYAQPNRQDSERSSKKAPHITMSAVPIIRNQPIPKPAVTVIPAAVQQRTLPNVAAKILEGARDEVKRGTQYLETYQVIPYPKGDVSPDIGVCTDLIIRAFRRAGIDLQQRLHEDRKANPGAYPKHLWDYKKPDRNIDHRRCQNLYVFFQRHAKSLTTETGAKHSLEWQPGDVVFFRRQGAEFPWHVAIIADTIAPDSSPRIFHLFPPRAAEASLTHFGPIHSHFRWPDDGKTTPVNSEQPAGRN